MALKGELQECIDAPNETLIAEYKSWLDLVDDPEAAIGDSADFVNALIDEVMAIFRKLKEDDIQPLRRAFCRSVFQFIDGVAFHLKYSVSLYESPALIDEDTCCALLGKRKLDRGGRVELVPDRPGFRKDLHFAFDVYGWTAGVNLDLREDRENWAKFLRSVSVRNRVVHPKRLKDLDISNANLKEMIETFVWVNKRLRNAHLRVGTAFMKQAKAMEAALLSNNWRKHLPNSDGSLS